MMTNAEVMKELGSLSRLNKARQKFSSWSARIEQRSMQGLPPVEMRRMEFEAVQDIVATYAGLTE